MTVSKAIQEVMDDQRQMHIKLESLAVRLVGYILDSSDPDYSAYCDYMERRERNLFQLAESTISSESKSEEIVNRILEDEGPHGYSCIMARLPKELADKIIAWGRQQISDDVLYVDEDGGCGREEDVHTTVKYGLTSVKPDDRLMDVFKKTEPFEVELAPITLFRNDKFDVVKLDVISPYLRALNRNVCAVAECPGDSHPNYHPHVTIAYCKPNTCDRLDGKSPFDNPIKFGVTSIEKDGKFIAKSVIFSSLNGTKSEFKLGS